MPTINPGRRSRNTTTTHASRIDAAMERRRASAHMARLQKLVDTGRYHLELDTLAERMIEGGGPTTQIVACCSEVNPMNALNLQSQTPPSPPPPKMREGARLLLIDDDPLMRRAIANPLSRAGFHVVTAEDEASGFFAAEQTPPDIAIVHLNTHASGLEVVRKLKALYGASLWIAVLADNDETMRLACFDAGADDVLTTPPAISEIRMRMFIAARTQQAYVETRIGRERADRLLAYGSEASAMLAHDLNNGLAVALGNMTYLLEVVKLEEDEKDALTATTSALRRMSGLVANFVDIARFEDAALKPMRAVTGLETLIRNVLELHSSAGPGSNLRFKVDCEQDLCGNLDPALIERVLHNLVGNATRYCATGGTIRITAKAWDTHDGTGVELTVFNNGPAVPEAMRDIMFKKYAKGSNGKRGLGLYFARLACEAHGGSIEYIACLVGTSFRVRLPDRE